MTLEKSSAAISITTAATTIVAGAKMLLDFSSLLPPSSHRMQFQAHSRCSRHIANALAPMLPVCLETPEHASLFPVSQALQQEDESARSDRSQEREGGGGGGCGPAPNAEVCPCQTA